MVWSGDNGVVRVTVINLTMRFYRAVMARNTSASRRIRLGGSIEANPATRSAKISDLACQIAAGTVAVKSLEVPDWARRPAASTPR